MRQADPVRPRPGRAAGRSLLPVLLALSAAAGCAPSGPGETDAMALMADMAAIYQAGSDGPAFASLWTDDGDFYSLSTGAHWDGRAAIDSAMTRVFERRNPASEVRLATERIRILGPELAIVDVLLSQDGTAVERMALVLVPADGEWRIAAARTGRVPVD